MASTNSTSKETFLSSSEGGITPASVIAVGAILPALATIAVSLRFYGRQFKTAVIGVDDWLILISLVIQIQNLTIGLGVMMIVGSALGGLATPTPQGTGKKGYLTATNDAEIITEKIFWSFDLVQCFAFGTAKLSVILFYRRIFRGDLFNYISVFMIAIVSIWTLGFFFAILFRCGVQFWALWAPLKYLLANCYVSTPMFQAFTISDVITDVLILAIPMYWTWQLHMSAAKRLAVCGIFLLGGVAVAAGIARLIIFIQQTNNPYLNADGIGHLTTEIYWSMIEMGISVIAACLPTIRPLFGDISPERVINSIRSIFSLQSLTSLTSSRRRGRSEESISARGAKYEQFSHSAHLKSTGGSSQDISGLESIAMRDVEAQHHLDRLPKDSLRSIVVKSRIEQRSEGV